MPLGEEVLVGAKIKSEWLMPLLGTRGDEMANYSGPLKGVNRALSDRLLVGLEKSASWPEAMAGMCETLAQVCRERGLDGTPSKSGLVQQAANLTRQAKGAISTSTLAEVLGVSERHLYRCFQGEVGISPKAISRRFRFLTAVGLADVAPVPDWAGIAAEAGYFDQSHMIRDFKMLCALTPRAVFSERQAESSFSNTL